MITVYRCTNVEKTGTWLDADALRTQAEELRSDRGVVWIDLEAPSPEEEALVFQQFYPVHALTLDDVTKQRRHGFAHFPKVEEFPDYLFVVINPLSEAFREHLKEEHREPLSAPEPAAITQLSAVMTKCLLITHHQDPLPSIQELRSFLSRHEADAQRGPDYLFHLVLDAMVDQYAPAIDHVDDRLDEAEEEILYRPTPGLLSKLLDLKRRIVLLRKTLVYEREILTRLARGEFALIDQREMVYYRNVYDHLVRFTELVESSREMAIDLAQTHLAAVSNKLNEIMKVLTIISVIFMPMTLITGIYGMNLEMPEKDWPHGYVFALGLMLLSALGALAFFRWRKWF